MLRARLCLSLLAVLIGVALAIAGAALASNSTPPRIVAPARGAAQKSGKVALVVDDPGLTGRLATPIFLIVSNKRALDRRGHLTASKHCRSRCDYEEMNRWRGHPGLWIYRAPYNYPGYWGVTPGTYYWQVYHYVPSCQPSCVEYSQINSFHVVR